MSKQAKNPSRKGATRLYIVQLTLMVLFIGGMAFTFFTVNTEEKYDQEYLIHAQELRVLSQQVAKNATEAAGGNPEAFSLLKDAATEIDAHLMHLGAGVGDEKKMSMQGMEHGADKGEEVDHTAAGHQFGDLPPAPEVVQPQLQAVADEWRGIRGDAHNILNGWQSVLGMYEMADTFNTTVPALQNLSDQATTIMIKVGASPSQVYISGRQNLLAERMVRNVRRILQGGIAAVTAADSFGRNSALFGRVLTGLLKGDRRLGIQRVNNRAAREKLSEAKLVFDEVSKNVGQILQSSPDLFQVREAADKIFTVSESMLPATAALERSFVDLSRTRLLSSKLGYVLGALAIINLIVLGVLMVKRSQEREQEQEQETSKVQQENDRNQAAILRLLDEMSNLADGDLTTTATVTEDITGAIADSINFAIEEMRNLVTTINRTSDQVNTSAVQTRATAMHLAEASDHQAQQITKASQSINDMATSIEAVSKDAEKSADVAKTSVDIAHKGAQTVRRTVENMDKIREAIQETSKRIKRLGESSQEIGDIVELINDIADQTNILALNAAIQAAMAGEAGRGFAVVADEVQRLAERSADATKQIETLIKTIQADTNEAVSSMEQTTSGVVTVAKLAEDAGEALDEIERVSGDVADLILDISQTAKKQVVSAHSVSDGMNVIQDITMQTSSGTNETAVSIGNLVELAKDLQKSVTGFKLPAQDSEAVDLAIPEMVDEFAGATEELAAEVFFEEEDLAAEST